MRLANRNIAWFATHCTMGRDKLFNPLKPYITQVKVYKVSNYTVVVTSFQIYAEDKFGGGVISRAKTNILNPNDSNIPKTN